MATPARKQIDECRRAAAALPPGPWIVERTPHLVHVVSARGDLIATADTRLALDDQIQIASALAMLPTLLTGLIAQLEVLEGGQGTATMAAVGTMVEARAAAAEALAALAPPPPSPRECTVVALRGPAFARGGAR